MKPTRRQKKGRRTRRKYTMRKMRGGLTTKLTEQEINIMLSEFLVCKYVNVDATKVDTKIIEISPDNFQIGATYIFYQQNNDDIFESGEGVLVSITPKSDKSGYTILYFDTLYNKFVEKDDIKSPARELYKPVPECENNPECEIRDDDYNYILYDTYNNNAPYYKINWMDTDTDNERAGNIYDKDNNKSPITDITYFKKYRVETHYTPQIKNKLDVFIKETPLLLRILTLTFIELMRIDMKNANNIGQLLESFTNKKNTFVTRGINYIQFPPIKKEKENDGEPESKDGLSKVINNICKYDDAGVMYDITALTFNTDYEVVENKLEERIRKFLASPHTDKKFGTLQNINSTYKKIIIVLNDIITNRKNTSFLSSITNVATNLVVKPQKIKMYKYACDYLRSQYSNYLKDKLTNNDRQTIIIARKIVKGLISGSIFIVVFQIIMTCGVSLAQQNYTDPKCNSYIIVLIILSGIISAIKTNTNIEIVEATVIPTSNPNLSVKTKTIESMSNEILPPQEQSSSFNSLKQFSNSIETSVFIRKLILKMHSENTIDGASVGSSFINRFYATDNTDIYKVIMTAFSHAFYNSINPLLSKSPLIILFSETVRMRN